MIGGVSDWCRTDGSDCGIPDSSDLREKGFVSGEEELEDAAYFLDLLG